MKSLFIFALLTAACFGQAWSGIIDPSRAIDWSAAPNIPGVSGGIPNRTTQCGSTIAAYTGTAATINTAISSCTPNQFVSLGAGTFNLSSGIDFTGTNNVTLRGQGANSTFLVFTGNANCLGQTTAVCIGGNDLSYYGPGPPTNIVNWTAGYAKGTTIITLSATTNLSVGMYIYIDQLDPVSDTGNIWACLAQWSAGVGCTVQGGAGGSNGRNGRSERQMTKVTNIAGNNVTISPGVYMPNFTSGQSPSAWWGGTTSLVHGDGIEDVSIDGTNSTATTNVTVIFAYDSWVKGVRSIIAPSPRTSFLAYQAAHITFLQNYIFGSVGDAASSLNYGIEDFGTSNDLIESNICQRRTSCFLMDAAVGTVSGYNYAAFDHYTTSPTFMQASDYSHEGDNGMELREGNDDIGLKADIIHSTSHLATEFRDFYTGWQNGNTSETNPVKLYSYQRYYNLIGSILGQPGYHNTYSGSDTAIYALGYGSAPVPSDPVTQSTLFRWGNWDVVNGSAQFNNSEVPVPTSSVTQVAATTTVATYTVANNWAAGQSVTFSGCTHSQFNNGGASVILASANSTTATVNGSYTTQSAVSDSCTGTIPYGNAIPASHTLPNSFYLTSEPGYFGNTPWPPIGSDVTGGTEGKCSAGTYAGSRCTKTSQCTGGGTCDTTAWAGHVNPNPAAQCYFNVMGGTPDGSTADGTAASALTFNRASCYSATGPTSAPAPIFAFNFNNNFCGTLVATNKKVCCKNGSGSFAQVAGKAWSPMSGSFAGNCRTQ